MNIDLNNTIASMMLNMHNTNHGNELSEGEIENPVIGLINKQKELVESGIKNLSESCHCSHKSKKKVMTKNKSIYNQSQKNHPIIKIEYRLFLVSKFFENLTL